MVAAVNGGLIYLSGDSGATWSASAGPVTNWVSVASSAGGDFIAAAAPGQLYLSTNSGASWRASDQTPGLLGNSYAQWKPITCSADGRVVIAGSFWAVGEAYGSLVAVSTNWGGTWAITGPGGIVTSLACSASGQVIFAATDASLGDWVWISTDSGGSWMPTAAPVASWGAVACSADGAKVIAGGDRGGSGPVFLSSDSGQSWQQVTNSGVTSAVVAMSADGKTMEAAGAPPSPISVFHDGGSSWSSAGSPDVWWASLASSADGTTLVAVVNGGGIYTLKTPLAPALSTSAFGTNLLLSWTVPSIKFVLSSPPA